MSTELPGIDFPFYNLQQSILNFLSNEPSANALHEIQTNLRKQYESLLNPLKILPLNSSDRQKISSGKVDYNNQEIAVNQAIQAEILKMADELKVNEIICFNYWLCASDESTRTLIERIAGYRAGSLRHDIPTAARECFFAERTALVSAICELLKARMDSSLDDNQHEVIMSYTNRLLKDDLASNLMKSLLEDIPLFAKVPGTQKFATIWQTIVMESLFSIFYQTQIKPNEIRLLINVIQTYSNDLSSLIASINQSNQSLQQKHAEENAKAASNFVNQLSTLSITLMCALDQSHELIDRETGEPNRIGVGNMLSDERQPALITELHNTIVHNTWSHSGFQGIAMLTWGLFLARSGASIADGIESSTQKPKEADELPLLVSKVPLLQAYSFLSSLMKTVWPRDSESYQSLYSEVVEELLTGYLSEVQTRLPLSRAQFIAEKDVQEDLHMQQSNRKEDCLEELIDCIISLTVQKPSFAKCFWKESNSIGNSKGLNDFLRRCLQVTNQDPSLFVAYMKLVAAIAVGDECSEFAYNFIKDSPPRLSWDHFFTVIRKYHQFLSSTPTTGLYDSSSTRLSSSSSNARRIRPEEVEALEAILGVVESVISSHPLRIVFYQNHDWTPITSFFGLLRCAIPSPLKGALMQTLAVFARSREIASEIWQHLETSQVLITCIQRGFGQATGGIKYELEQVESYEQTYPATRGFVSLVSELMKSNVIPYGLGTGVRVPGIHPYIDFLRDSIFLKFDNREYKIHEERWTIAYGVLSVFKVILDSYQIQEKNAKTSGNMKQMNQFDFQDEWIEVPGYDGYHKLPKSLGFQLMQHLLSDSSLLRQILHILSYENGVNALEVSNESNIEEILQLVQYSTSQRSKNLSHFPMSRISMREKCVLLCLDILYMAMDKEMEFLQRCRESSTPLQAEPLATLLLRANDKLVCIARYIEYSKNYHIAMLSARILFYLSMRIPSRELVHAFEDNGYDNALLNGYVSRLLSPNEREYLEQAPIEDTTNEHKMAELGSKLSKKVSIRQIIVRLLLNNFEKPAPNLSHLLLGLTKVIGNRKMELDHPITGPQNCLQAILELITSHSFVSENPIFAESCHELIFRLCSHKVTSCAVLKLLRQEYYDFFYHQLRLIPLLPKIGSTHNETIAFQKIRSWILQGIAVELHTSITHELPQLGHVRRFLSLLFSEDESNPRDTFNRSQHLHNALDQRRMLLLEMFDATTFIMEPPQQPEGHIVKIAEGCTELRESGGQSYLYVVVEMLNEALQSIDGLQNVPSSSLVSFGQQSSRLSNSNSSSIEKYLQWAVQWNNYSERVASEASALESWSRLAQIVLFECLSILTPTNSSTSVESFEMDLIFRLLEAVLVKMALPSAGVAQLLQILACASLSLMCQLREHATNKKRWISIQQCQILMNAFVQSLKQTTRATGNPSASRTARSLIYATMLHFFRYSESYSKNITPKSNETTKDMVQHELMPFITSSLNGCGDALIELVCRDATDGDRLRTSLAISFLDALVQYNPNGTIRILFIQGYLQHFSNIFREFGRLMKINNLETTPSIEQVQELQAMEIVYESTMALLTRIAQHSDGAQALTEYGTINLILESDFIPKRYSSNSIMNMETDDQLKQEQTMNEQFLRIWKPILTFLSTMLTTLPSNTILVKQSCEFVLHYHKLISFALKFRQPTLSLLEEITLITSILVSLISFRSIYDEILTVNGKKYIRLILNLLQIFGVESLPQDVFGSLHHEKEPYSNLKTMNRSIALISSSTSTNKKPIENSWWKKILPFTLSEQRRHELLISYPKDVIYDQWSAFEVDKFNCSRRLISNLVTFCRQCMLSTSNSTTFRKSMGLTSIKEIGSNEINLLFTFSNKKSVYWIGMENSITLEHIIQCLDHCISALTPTPLHAKSLISTPSNDLYTDHTGSISLHDQFSYLNVKIYTEHCMYVIENLLTLLCFHLEYLVSNIQNELELIQQGHKTSNQWNLPTSMHSMDMNNVPIPSSNISNIEDYHLQLNELKQLAKQILCLIDGLEDNPFIHYIARKLREIEFTSKFHMKSSNVLPSLGS